MSVDSESSRLFVSSGDMPDDVWQHNVLGRYRLSSHLVPFYVYVPVVIVLAVIAITWAGVSLAAFCIAFLAALPLWTLNEYVTHRFLFHYEARNSFVRKLVYTMHTGHHEYPNDKRFMLIGLNVSLPNTLITGLLFYVVTGQHWYGLLAGWLSAYLFYDWLHFATHVYNFEARWFRAYKKHHLQHHYKHNDKNYGVVTALWDYVMRTKLREAREEDASQAETPETVTSATSL